MPAINFRKQFAGLVEFGEKNQTIRPIRKHPIKSGDMLYLYTGLRTKQCRKLRKVVCKEAIPIQINLFGIVLDGKNISQYEIMKIIRMDGFERCRDFFEFFNKQYELPFKGVMIKW